MRADCATGSVSGVGGAGEESGVERGALFKLFAKVFGKFSFDGGGRPTDMEWGETGGTGGSVGEAGAAIAVAGNICGWDSGCPDALDFLVVPFRGGAQPLEVAVGAVGADVLMAGGAPLVKGRFARGASDAGPF